ncbi:hypothetical protein B0H11DRAFT_927841 [Mycena galericulata]|nr:hypothetical protein B0H11DRAFT_927841 [Mycena galericulata]
MPSADRSDSPDDREKDEGRGGGKKSAASKAKDLSHVPCKFYKVGSCTAGSSCPFSHSLVEPGGQKDVCAWFVKGNCKFGHKCALAHVLPGQTMAMDRKNKKAAQIAAGGAKRDGGGGGEGKGRGGSKREGGGGGNGNGARNNNNGLLAGGSTAPTRARPPMNMPLKATISPSAPAPPLKDTDFASFGVLDEASQLPTAPARRKSPDPPTTTSATGNNKPPSPTLPVSAPRRPSVNSPSPSKDFGPIGSPPSSASATSPSSRMRAGLGSGTPPTTQNGFLSTSPFSAPGPTTQSVFLSSGGGAYGEGGGARKGLAMGGMGMAASLGSGIAMGMGGAGGWNGNGTPSSPHRGSLLSASRAAAANSSSSLNVNGYRDDMGINGRVGREPSEGEDFEDFLPSSLTDLLTPEERSRRMSRTNSGQGGGGVVIAGGGGGGGGGGHRYSRSVPAPSLLGGDLKSIWAAQAQDTHQGLPSSPLHGPSSYSSASGLAGGFGGRESGGGVGGAGGAGGGTAGSFVDDRDRLNMGMRGLSPSNASAAFLPGIHHYIAQNKQRAAGANGLGGNNNGGGFASNAALTQGPPGLAHYLNAGPSGVAGANNNGGGGTGGSNGGTGSPYVLPNPFDLTQGLHNQQQRDYQQQQQQQQQQREYNQPAAPPGIAHPHGGMGIGALGMGAHDTHILSPNARALQAHAPGQSLPQGLAAGYSRIHALPPLGSPSPAAFSPGLHAGSPGAVGGFGNSPAPNAGGMTTSAFGGRDWSTMSSGSISGSPGAGFLASAVNANANAQNSGNNNANAGQGQQQKGFSPPGTQTLETIMGRLSYSAATKAPAPAGAGPGAGVAAPGQVQRNASGGLGGAGGGSRWAAPLSPPNRPVASRGGDDDELFALDE